jgi:hypothetical protein
MGAMLERCPEMQRGTGRKRQKPCAKDRALIDDEHEK